MEENKQRSANDSSKVIHPKVISRGKILMGIAFGLLGLLLLRILIYQTVGYGKYQQKVIDQMTTESAVLADRGNIYDANGVLLATNVTTYRVFIAPSAIAAAQTEMDRQGEGIRLDSMIAEELADLLSLNVQYIMEQTSYTTKLDRTLKNKVNEETADLVREVIDARGWQQFVHLQATSTRYYPYSELASQVLGFTGSDGSGLYGLEYYYDEQLAGTNGRYIIARDAQGNEMPYGYEKFIAAEDGYHLNTTIDVYVQSALEEQVKTAYIESRGENRASGIVMNVNTGAVLGMATYPNFDLNDPWTLDSQSESLLANRGFDENSEDYSKMRQALLLNMWSNKAITESYIPGSTFKVITAAMVLEEAVVAVDSTFHCPGYKVVADRTIHCHKTQGHGTLTFTQGIQQSCNPVLMSVGLALGGDKFDDYLGAFGYREKTKVDLPGEGTGVLFSGADLQSDLNLAISSFGQNINVTLMQQITAVSAVANGGYLVTPHFISSITDIDGNVIKSFDTQVRRQVVSAETCKTVADILEKGVSGDGGAKNAYVTGYRVAAKTGTSEKKEHECPKCDSTAISKKVEGKGQYQCTGCNKLISEDQFAKDENGKTIYKCPTCTKSVETLYVCSICGLTGLLKSFDKSSDYVCSTVAFAPADNPQYAVIIIVDEPTAGVLYGSTVAAPYVGNVMETILPYLGVEAVYTEEELAKMTVTVPSIVGWSGNAAKKACESRGLTVEIVGETSGVVNKQYPEGGTVVEKSGGKVVIYTSREATVQTVKMPDVTGMSAVAANGTLINSGLNIRIRGTKNYLSGTGAVVVKQSVEAGTEVPRGSVIEVTFRYLGDEDYAEGDLN